MPVTARQSAKQQTVNRKSRISRKRRENQNVEINELASLIPLSSSLVPGQGSSNGLVPATNGGSKLPTIPVLRLTTSFLKLQNFVKTTSSMKNSCGEHVSTDNMLGRMEENATDVSTPTVDTKLFFPYPLRAWALDGFLIILDKEANILYVSETMAGYVGVIQQDVIGQNLVDITHPEFSSEIQDSLKPAVLLSTTVEEDCIVSQYRQFHVRFIPNVAYSTSPSHTLVQVCGNLKVKLSPVKSCADGVMEFVEPSAVGFIGECRVVESVPSILEISVPCSSFIVARTPDLKKVISIEASVKDVTGYDPEMMLDASINIDDFFHPADVNVMISLKNNVMRSGRVQHIVSPCFRFLTSSGDWIWLQMEGALRYRNKNGISTPQHWEVKVRALGQWDGRLKYLEQKELYTSESDHTLSISDKSPDITPNLSNLEAKRSNDEGTSCTTQRMINSLKSARLPDTVLEPVLHGRSLAMSEFSEAVKRFLSKSETEKLASLSIGGDSAAQQNGNRSVSITRCTDGASDVSPGSVFVSPLTSNVGCQTNSSSLRSSYSPPQVLSDSSSLNSGSGAIQPLSNGSVLAQSDLSPITNYSDNASVDNFQTVAVSNGNHRNSYRMQGGFIIDPVHLGQNAGLQNPLLTISSDQSSAVSPASVLPTQQAHYSDQQFGQFMNINPTGSCGPMVDSYDPVASMDLSLLSPDTGTTLNSAMSTDSIPSASPVSFSSSHSSDFVPQSTENVFNPQIPPNFNFSCNMPYTNHSPSLEQSTSTYCMPNLTANVSVSQGQMPSCSSVQRNLNNTPLAQPMLESTMMMTNSIASVPDCSSSMDAFFSQGDQSHVSMQINNMISPGPELVGQLHANNDHLSQLLSDSQIVDNSNCEVEDILQQFM